MALSVRYTRRAATDLKSIRTYLIERSPTGRRRVQQEILATINLLTSFPHLGPATDEPGVRRIQLRTYPYRIFYMAA